MESMKKCPYLSQQSAPYFLQLIDIGFIAERGFEPRNLSVQRFSRPPAISIKTMQRYNYFWNKINFPYDQV